VFLDSLLSLNIQNETVNFHFFADPNSPVDVDIEELLGRIHLPSGKTALEIASTVASNQVFLDNRNSTRTTDPLLKGVGPFRPGQKPGHGLFAPLTGRYVGDYSRLLDVYSVADQSNQNRIIVVAGDTHYASGGQEQSFVPVDRPFVTSSTTPREERLKFLSTSRVYTPSLFATLPSGIASFVTADLNMGKFFEEVPKYSG